MTFGPFTVKTQTGKLRIASSADAAAFIRSVGKRGIPRWRVAERMVEFAWMSEADKEAAVYAFRHALEADDLLLE